MTASLPFTYPVVPTSGKGRGIFRPRARYFPGMESTQRSPGRRPHKVRFTRNAQAWAFLVRSLARPLPTTTQGRGWVPGGSAPYDFRTRSARLENGLNLFGAAMNLGPLRPPPAAARAGQIRWSFFPHIAPLVCLAFSALLGAFSLFRRARFLHRAMTRIKNAPSSVIAYGDATFPPVWGRLFGVPLRRRHKTRFAGLLWAHWVCRCFCRAR